MRMGVGIGISIAIFIVTLFLIAVLITPPLWLLFASSGVVTSLLYFSLVFPNVTFIVPENKAWIMVNRFVPESLLVQARFSGNRDIRAQKEFQAGFHWKYLWETKAEDGEINMKKVILVESDDDATYTMRNGKTIKIKYQVLVVPLPGNIVNHFRTREEDIKRRIKARAEKFLQGHIGKLLVIKFDKTQQDILKKAFEKVWGGPDVIDDEERELGIWTGTPEVYDIGNPKGVEDALNWQTNMATAINIAKQMVINSGNQMPFEQAMKIAVAGQGLVKMDFFEVTGNLLGMSSTPKIDKSKGGGK